MSVGKNMITKNNGLLTIVIPCYNAEKYLSRCLSSLEGLEFGNISILFVNDGSTDSTQTIIEAWMKNHKNTSMINKDNGGYSSAINVGLNNCNSEYVMFLGVDDEVLPEGINNVCLHLRQNSPDIIAFSTRKYFDDLDGGVSKGDIDTMTYYSKPGLYNMDICSLFKILGNDARILFTRDTSRCFKMSVINDLRYFGKTGTSSDGCFSSLMAIKASSFEFLNETCYFWHLHNDSVSGRKKTPEKLVEEAEVWNEYFCYIQNVIEDVKIPDPIINHLFVYKRLILTLFNMNLDELAKKHEERYEIFSRWAIKSETLSLKSRIKLLFPKSYIFMVENRNRLKA